MDLMEAIAIFIASILAGAMTDRLVLVAPLWQATVDILLVGQNQRPRQDRLFDQRLDRFLAYVLQHAYDDLAATFDHTKDRRLLLLQRAAPACTLEAVSPPLTAFFLLRRDALCDQPPHTLHRMRQFPAEPLAACA